MQNNHWTKHMTLKANEIGSSPCIRPPKTTSTELNKVQSTETKHPASLYGL